MLKEKSLTYWITLFFLLYMLHFRFVVAEVVVALEDFHCQGCASLLLSQTLISFISNLGVHYQIDHLSDRSSLSGDGFSCINNNYPQVENMVNVYGISIRRYHATNCAGECSCQRITRKRKKKKAEKEGNQGFPPMNSVENSGTITPINEIPFSEIEKHLLDDSEVECPDDSELFASINSMHSSLEQELNSNANNNNNIIANDLVSENENFGANHFVVNTNEYSGVNDALVFLLPQESNVNNMMINPPTNQPLSPYTNEDR